MGKILAAVLIKTFGKEVAHKSIVLGPSSGSIPLLFSVTPLLLRGCSHG